MPLHKGKGKEVVSKNISEFHGGKTFAHTAEKFGKKTADKQAVAVALNEQRKSGGGKKSHGITNVGEGNFKVRPVK